MSTNPTNVGNNSNNNNSNNNNNAINKKRQSNNVKSNNNTNDDNKIVETKVSIVKRDGGNNNNNNNNNNNQKNNNNKSAPRNLSITVTGDKEYKAVKKATMNAAIANSPNRKEVSVDGPDSPTRRLTSNYTETYGVVFSLKGSFGFIQPINEDDQVFFSEREFYENIKIGDKVGYIRRIGGKGVMGEKVRYLNMQTEEQFLANGVVLRNHEHYSGFGILEIELSTITADNKDKLNNLSQKFGYQVKDIPYRLLDVTTSSLPKGIRKLEKGDYVKFSVNLLGHNTSFLHGTHVELIELKKQRNTAIQIKKMLEAGVKREMGSITSIKRGDFGFIKCIDRKDEIYFRLDDINNGEQVKEGTEVEFFVIVESIKGKMSDRAVHLLILPPGTVKFEVSIGKGAFATVIETSESYPEELPGMAKLDIPLSIEVITGKKGELIHQIEIWQRCLPEDLICKVGDRLCLDVQYYRPEKLYFARSVKVSSFRKIGREIGKICSLKEHGFGFIYSPSRNIDIYFRTTQVIGGNGVFIDESALKMDMYLSFDVVMEKTHNGVKYKAQRVTQETQENADKYLNGDSSFILLKGLSGIVTKNSTKKDAPGLIKIFPEYMKHLKDLDFFEPGLKNAIEEFRDMPEIKQVEICGLTNAALKSYYNVIEALFPGIKHDTTLIDSNDPSMGKVLTITKVDMTEYTQWMAQNDRSKYKLSGTGSEGDNDNVVTILKDTKQKERTSDNIQFYRDDYISEVFGPIANDLKVEFDLGWDSVRNRKVAKSIRLTDEPVTDGPPHQDGVIEVVIEKSGGKFGFIRCLETDEKLFWHISPNSSNSKYLRDIVTGTEVSFDIRRRGGLRCAVNMEVVVVNSLRKEYQIPIPCTALVIENNRLILVDVSKNTFINKRYLDCNFLNELLVQHKEQKNPSWEKVKPEDETPSPVLINETLGDAVGDSQETDVNGVVEKNELKREESEELNTTDYKAKYFPPLPRQPVPFTVADGVGEVTVGCVVNCLIVVDPVLQRSPVSAIITSYFNMSPTSTNCLKAVKKKGRIDKIKFRMKVPKESSCVNSDILSVYNIPTIDFVELFDLEERSKEQRLEDLLSLNSTKQISMNYYCDFREVMSPDDYREPPQFGDEVEFWTLPLTGVIAFNVSLLGKNCSKEFGGISFNKRQTINSELKEKGAANIISMAQGPPNDSSTGFAWGWRGENKVSVSELPWGHLLPHLSPQS